MIFRLLIFLLVFYLVYFVVKTLFIKPFKDGYRSSSGPQGRREQRPSREGEVTISYNPQEGKRNDDKTGEYIDYEEVKD